MLLRNSLGEAIQTYCLFDRDFHSQEDIEARYAEANKKGVSLHVWSRKEIENYVLDPEVICDFIKDRISARTAAPEIAEILGKIDEIADSFEDATLDAFASEFIKHDRPGGPAQANRKAREVIRACRKEHGSIQFLVSGKQLIAKLSDWSNSEFGVSFSPHALLKSMAPDQVPLELRRIITAIETLKPFPDPVLVASDDLDATVRSSAS